MVLRTHHRCLHTYDRPLRNAFSPGPLRALSHAAPAALEAEDPELGTDVFCPLPQAPKAYTIPEGCHGVQVRFRSSLSSAQSCQASTYVLFAFVAWLSCGLADAFCAQTEVTAQLTSLLLQERLQAHCGLSPQSVALASGFLFSSNSQPFAGFGVGYSICLPEVRCSSAACATIMAIQVCCISMPATCLAC